MIEAVESFLTHMKWDERQALVVCHDDKHPHVHIMLNSVHPETGCALDTSFERRRAQEWALAYERDHEFIFCEERLKPAFERTSSPTRATWEKLRDYERQDDRAEQERFAKESSYFEQGGVNAAASLESEMLKALQREEREQFLVEGKEAYRAVRHAVYRQVRAEFREDWNNYFAAKRVGLEGEPLAAMKTDILERPNEMLEARRKAACATLREERDQAYAAMLQRHTEQRHQFNALQRESERSYDLLDTSYPVNNSSAPAQGNEAARQQLLAEFRETSVEIGLLRHAEDEGPAREERDLEAPGITEQHKARDPADAIGGLGLGAIGAIATLGERLFDGFMGGGMSIGAGSSPVIGAQSRPLLSMV
jgi:MobA/VirD2-like, nuclease domain